MLRKLARVLAILLLVGSVVIGRLQLMSIGPKRRADTLCSETSGGDGEVAESGGGKGNGRGSTAGERGKRSRPGS